MDNLDKECPACGAKVVDYHRENDYGITEASYKCGSSIHTGRGGLHQSNKCRAKCLRVEADRLERE